MRSGSGMTSTRGTVILRNGDKTLPADSKSLSKNLNLTALRAARKESLTIVCEVTLQTRAAFFRIVASERHTRPPPCGGGPKGSEKPDRRATNDHGSNEGLEARPTQCGLASRISEPSRHLSTNRAPIRVFPSSRVLFIHARDRRRHPPRVTDALRELTTRTGSTREHRGDPRALARRVSAPPAEPARVCFPLNVRHECRSPEETCITPTVWFLCRRASRSGHFPRPNTAVPLDPARALPLSHRLGRVGPPSAPLMVF